VLHVEHARLPTARPNEVVQVGRTLRKDPLRCAHRGQMRASRLDGRPRVSAAPLSVPADCDRQQGAAKDKAMGPTVSFRDPTRWPKQCPMIRIGCCNIRPKIAKCLAFLRARHPARSPLEDADATRKRFTLTFHFKRRVDCVFGTRKPRSRASMILRYRIEPYSSANYNLAIDWPIEGSEKLYFFPDLSKRHVSQASTTYGGNATYFLIPPAITNETRTDQRLSATDVSDLTYRHPWVHPWQLEQTTKAISKHSDSQD
jgi:hypothetical protein